MCSILACAIVASLNFVEASNTFHRLMSFLISLILHSFGLQLKLNNNDLPDIILMDVNMPRMDGFATVQWLRVNFPDVKVLVVSMIEKEESIVRMLKLGVKGYLCKVLSRMSWVLPFAQYMTKGLLHRLYHRKTGSFPSA
jgi:CheY-like chemotaxis protein